MSEPIKGVVVVGWPSGPFQDVTTGDRSMAMVLRIPFGDGVSEIA